MNVTEKIQTLVTEYHRKMRRENGTRPITKDQFNSLVVILDSRSQELFIREMVDYNPNNVNDFHKTRMASMCGYNVQIFTDMYAHPHTVIVAHNEFTTE